MTMPYQTISEVSEILAVPPHTLRYWEKQFPSIIKPTTAGGGRRYYRAETVADLILIKKYLHNDGLTIAGLQKLIKAGDWKSETRDQRPEIRDQRSELDDVINLLERAKKELSFK